MWRFFCKVLTPREFIQHLIKFMSKTREQKKKKKIYGIFEVEDKKNYAQMITASWHNQRLP